MASSHWLLSSPAFISIPGGLQAGSLLMVHGVVSSTEPSFLINFQASKDADSDIAFHFNPRIDELEVVRNSYQSDWATEERETPFFPFSYDSEFTVYILCTADAFVTYVNGSYFTQFKHRLNYQDAHFVNLSKGATYQEVMFKHPARVPYKLDLDELVDGAVVRVRGSVNEDAYRFGINFNCDQSGHNVGMHFNARQDEKETVLNTKTDGTWGEEERSENEFPFTQGQFFDVYFQVHNGAFIVFANGRHLHTFSFRVPLETIRFLDIYGDISLMDVDVCNQLLNDIVVPMPSGFQRDDMVVVEGYFKPEAQKFIVDLLNGLSPNSDIALHINPRKDEKEIVVNNTVGGVWQTEVRYSMKDMDPDATQDMVNFQLCIVNKETRFDLYCNGKKFGDFPSRGNMADIKGIYCTADAYYHSARVHRKLNNPTVIQLGATPANGDWFSVMGIPTEDVVHFTVDFKTGGNAQPSVDDDIAFHYNPNIPAVVTVRNTWDYSGWGKEEKEEEGGFPFTKEDIFEVNTLLTADSYKVYANGRHHIDYNHRIAAEKLSHVVTRRDADFYKPTFY